MKNKNIFLKRNILVACLSLASIGVYAQTITVKGTVTDPSNKPVVGATINVKGKATKVVTDQNGNYTITGVMPDDVLHVFNENLKAEDVKIAGRSVVNFTMEDSVKDIEDVVIVGYGKQKRATVTGAVVSVTGETLRTPGVANVANTLAGQMAGLIVNTRSGEPGSDGSNILIRGIGTFGSIGGNLNAGPLIVIDGIAERAGLDRISPNDIESVTVLKDASAAIYGARSANGVILITTKRGKSGKPIISYDGNYSLSEFVYKPKLMNAYEYMTWADEMTMANSGQTTYQNIKKGYLDGTINRNQFADTDWMKVTFADFSAATRHNVSVRGGNESVKYYVSGNYLYQEPQFRNTVNHFETQQLRSNIDAKISKDLSVNFDIDARKEIRNNNVVPTNVMYHEAFNAYPFLHDFYPNGLPGPGVANGNNLAIMSKGELTGYNRSNDLYLNTKVGFDLKMPWVVKGLSLSGYAAFDNNFYNNKNFKDIWDTYKYNATTGNYVKSTTNNTGGFRQLNQSSANSLMKTYHIKLNFERKFGAHEVNAFVAYEQNQFYTENIGAERRNFLSSKPDYLNFGDDKLKTNEGTAFESARQNFFGRVNYAFKNRYLAEFTVRHDGSMNFPKDKRWGTFPGVSLGWRLSEESFIKDNLTFINELKLRGSWGQMGNDLIDPYQYISTYNLFNGSILGSSPTVKQGFFPGVIGNPDITWERADNKNLALDASLWNNKLTFTFEVFRQKRNDILTIPDQIIPGYAGINLPVQNLGAMTNEGFEVTINHQNKAGEFRYNIGGNFTYAKNTINFIGEAAGLPEWQKQTGLSYGTWLMLNSVGIYKNMNEVNNSTRFPGTKPGDFKYADTNGDGQITADDQIRSKYGNIPRIMFGINMGVEFKSFQLSALWQGQAQVEQMIVPWSTLNSLKELYDGRFVDEASTPNPRYPRAFDTSMNIARRSTFWLQDASFIRLKNLQLAYNFPKEVLETLKMRDLRIYVTGTNLVTFSKVRFQDAEANSTSAGQNYPQLRTYTLGLSFSF